MINRDDSNALVAYISMPKPKPGSIPKYTSVEENEI